MTPSPACRWHAMSITPNACVLGLPTPPPTSTSKRCYSHHHTHTPLRYREQYQQKTSQPLDTESCICKKHELSVPRARHAVAPSAPRIECAISSRSTSPACRGHAMLITPDACVLGLSNPPPPGTSKRCYSSHTPRLTIFFEYLHIKNSQNIS